MEHGRGIGRPLRADLVLEVAFLASKCGFPFIPLFDSYLVAGVAQVYFSEHLGQVQTILHLGDEGEREAVFHRDAIQAMVVDHQPEFTIRPLHEHDRGCSRGLRRPDEAIGKVLLNISFHCREFWG